MWEYQSHDQACQGHVKALELQSGMSRPRRSATATIDRFVKAQTGQTASRWKRELLTRIKEGPYHEQVGMRQGRNDTGLQLNSCDLLAWIAI